MTEQLVYLGPMLVSGRVRFVVSWNSSGKSFPGASYQAIPDFDVFLVNITRSYHVFYASMSFEDNNEGFDVDLGALPGNNDGDEWEIRLGWLPNDDHLNTERVRTLSLSDMQE